MELGAGFPQEAIQDPRVDIRDFAQAVEELGYAHLRVSDHVLGADPAHHTLAGPYNHHARFHEPFVLFGYLAAVTSRVKLVTSVLILSQRQTALVAKQAAEADMLSGGRLVLGVGTGWNTVEYEGLGTDFATRGARLDEQIALLRALWEQELVNFEGRFHRVRYAGLNPRPEGRIPIWMGGGAPVMMRRIGRVGDGWLVPPRLHKPEELAPRLEAIRSAAEAAGRDPAAIGIGMSVNSKGKDAAEQVRRAREWERAGATHFTVSTGTAGFASLSEHVEALRTFREQFANS
jgi:probable F420-dependent oxidoreductase